MILRNSNYVTSLVPHCNMRESGENVSQPRAKISVLRSCIELQLLYILFYLFIYVHDGFTTILHFMASNDRILDE